VSDSRTAGEVRRRRRRRAVQLPAARALRRTGPIYTRPWGPGQPYWRLQGTPAGRPRLTATTTAKAAATTTARGIAAAYHPRRNRRRNRPSRERSPAQGEVDVHAGPARGTRRTRRGEPDPREHGPCSTRPGDALVRPRDAGSVRRRWFDLTCRRLAAAASPPPLRIDPQAAASRSRTVTAAAAAAAAVASVLRGRRRRRNPAPLAAPPRVRSGCRYRRPL
jgi:hypothetical protein